MSLRVCRPSVFDGYYNVLFCGEADETWPEFVDRFAAGKPIKQFYKQRQPTDMTKLPKPRFDLLKVKRYAGGAIQFSRGCPFQCEICDIIVTFGRRPRTKRPEQVVEELDEMRKAGFFSCFIVDDNFIGNKKAAKELLRLIIPWQDKHGYPLRLATEASVNLADDPSFLSCCTVRTFAPCLSALKRHEWPLSRKPKNFKTPRETHSMPSSREFKCRFGHQRRVHR
jgi:radical SAM superfamily enzyme YgiQ (UPF0313 family)